MQCKCKERIEAQLLEKFKTESPDATDHSVELTGYGITIGDKLDLRAGALVAQSCKRAAKATGRVMEKKSTITMFFTYCPFCGTPAESGDRPGWLPMPPEADAEMLDAAAKASMQHLLEVINDPDRWEEAGSEESVRKTHASRYGAMFKAVHPAEGNGNG